MSYLWKNFNIKTFVSETVVFRDGKFRPELSTLSSTNILKTYKKPVHIIYVGNISGKNELNVNIFAKNQKVFLSLDIKVNKKTLLNISVKNCGKNSDFRGHIILDNFDNLEYNCQAIHCKPDTTILIKTKLLAEKASFSKLYGVAVIEKNCKNTASDIDFSALSDKSAKIQFIPAQKISSIPRSAKHSASIHKPKPIQIEFLRESGLTKKEINNVLREAFVKDLSLF